MIGEPEAGKGWFILHLARDELLAGGRVLYVDFEDDESTVVGRLHFELGVPAETRVERFSYVRPDGPGARYYSQLLEQVQPTLVILDGVTEGYGLHGWVIEDNNDTPKWRLAMVKPALRIGVATLSTDHVVKTRGTETGSPSVVNTRKPD